MNTIDPRLYALLPEQGNPPLFPQTQAPATNPPPTAVAQEEQLNMTQAQPPPQPRGHDQIPNNQYTTPQLAPVVIDAATLVRFRDTVCLPLLYQSCDRDSLLYCPLSP